MYIRKYDFCLVLFSLLFTLLNSISFHKYFVFVSVDCEFGSVRQIHSVFSIKYCKAMASKLIDIHNMIKRNASVLSDSSPICKDQHSSNGETNSISSLSPSSSSHSASSTDQYEYPRGYFEALINNAKARYDEALKFYHMKRTYSAKFGFYITLLQDIFIELASPPPTLPSDTYRKLAKLRQDIRWLQLNLESRRDLLSTIPTSTLDLSSARSEIGEGDKSEAEHHEDSVYEQEAARAKLGRLRQMEMAQLLQTITDLSLQELQIRQRRLEAEAEYRRQFNENPPTPVAALALKLPANAVPESVTSTIKSPGDNYIIVRLNLFNALVFRYS